MKNQTDFSSRIGVRGVAAGIIATVSFMLLSLSLMVALQIWNFKISSISGAGPEFWIFGTFFWALSMYLGGLVAALGARSQSKLEGMLNAAAACCGCYLLSLLAIMFFAHNAIWNVLNWAAANDRLPQFFMRIFLAHFVAFVVGIYGGVVGARLPLHSKQNIKDQRKFMHSENYV